MKTDKMSWKEYSNYLRLYLEDEHQEDMEEIDEQIVDASGCSLPWEESADEDD